MDPSDYKRRLISRSFAPLVFGAYTRVVVGYEIRKSQVYEYDVNKPTQKI